jgi:cell division protein FtsZ
MKGAKGVLINITGGPDMTLFEVDAAANRIREEIGEGEANIIFGSTFNPLLEGTMRVSVVATGIDAESVISIRSEAERHIAAHNKEAAQIEPIIQENSEETILEEVSIPYKASEESSETYDAPPKFGEYNIPTSTTNSTYSPPHQAQTTQSDSGPLALLRKMWGMTSIKPVPNTMDRERQSTLNEQPNAQVKEQVGEVYEIPAFLRRK